jgi:poly-gamma-glutamate synthesis protein (capsule biosynthesis protein)
LKESNIDILNLANNHTLDHGEQAFADMVKNLHKNDIKTFGYSINEKFQKRPLIIEQQGIKIGFLGYNFANLSSSELNILVGKVIGNIIAAKTHLDFLVLSLHWGYEYTDSPPYLFIDIGKKFLDNGADILYGHHSHQLQGVINYDNKILAPSLGNFVFDNPFKKNRLTAVLQVEIQTHQKTINFKLIPYYINISFQPEKKIALTKKVERLNKLLNRLVTVSSKSRSKIDQKSYLKSKLGHLKNRVYIRFSFFRHISNYHPHILEIIRKKIVLGKL